MYDEVIISKEDAGIVGAACTLMGGFQGALPALNTPQVGALAIDAAWIKKYGLRPGIASSCIGGKQTTTIALERIA